MIGRIDSFHSFSTSDGPGIRAVVFMQGCPLRCKCCHNPETWDFSKGVQMSLDEIMGKIEKGYSYYKKGGVTASGGEAVMQASFVTEMFKACHKLSLHTTLDTSGCLLNQDVEELLRETDLVLLDIKMTTEEAYDVFAKGSLKQTLKFLNYLEGINKPTWIRHVVIPGVNDTLEDAHSLKDMLSKYTCIKRVDFLPFRSLCMSKYKELGIEFPYQDVKDASVETIEKMQAWYQ